MKRNVNKIVRGLQRGLQQGNWHYLFPKLFIYFDGHHKANIAMLVVQIRFNKFPIHGCFEVFQDCFENSQKLFYMYTCVNTHYQISLLQPNDGMCSFSYRAILKIWNNRIYTRNKLYRGVQEKYLGLWHDMERVVITGLSAFLESQRRE